MKKNKIQQTLCVIHKNTKILLGFKKIGLRAGCLIGFGGHVEKGESVKGAARRELLEEAGIEAINIEELGTIDFEFKDNPEILEVHIFKSTDFEGTPFETEEMIPQWFDVNKIPFDKMWPDEKYWMPLFLKNKKFEGKFIFEGMDKILDYTLEEI